VTNPTHSPAPSFGGACKRHADADARDSARPAVGSSTSTARASTAVTSLLSLMVGVTFALNPATRPSVSRRVAYTDSTRSKPTNGDSSSSSNGTTSMTRGDPLPAFAYHPALGTDNSEE
jgi:hypothetical protein